MVREASERIDDGLVEADPHYDAAGFAWLPREPAIGEDAPDADADTVLVAPARGESEPAATLRLACRTLPDRDYYALASYTKACPAFTRTVRAPLALGSTKGFVERPGDFLSQSVGAEDAVGVADIPLERQ
jgi:hypothetical protein